MQRRARKIRGAGGIEIIAGVLRIQDCADLFVKSQVLLVSKVTGEVGIQTCAGRIVISGKLKKRKDYWKGLQSN